MEKNSFFDRVLNLLLIIIVLLLLATISCSPKYPNTHTPTKREINRAMKYSTSEYYMVKPKIYCTYESVYKQK
jgi:uracil-DNA glycosylase